MTDRIEEIKKRRAAITIGSWKLHHDKDDTWIHITSDALCFGVGIKVAGLHNAEFIAAAPDDVDFLLGEVERLRGENEHQCETNKGILAYIVKRWNEETKDEILKNLVPLKGKKLKHDTEEGGE